MIKKLISKNVPYQGVRAVIVGSQSTNQFTWYSEGRGDRFYVNEITGTATPVLEAASFQSYLSFTSSGTQSFQFNIIPLGKGENCVVETTIYAQNYSAQKGYIEKVVGAWRHTGTSINLVGGTLSRTRFTDFTTVDTTWGAVGTQSVRITCLGQTSELIDWDIYINYTKGTHLIATQSGATGSTTPGTPLYPSA